MLLLSFCRQFDSRFFAGPVQLKTSSGTLFEGQAAIDKLAQEVEGKRTLVLICGYNNKAQEAIESYHAIESTMVEHGLIGGTAGYESIVGVLWPGHEGLGFWLAELDANKAGKALAVVLGQIHPTSLDIETHSLGARVALSGLSQENVKNVRYLILTSPAVDSKVLSPEGEFWLAHFNFGSSLVCWTGTDPVLARWYSTSERILNFFIRQSGMVALGLVGPEHSGQYGITDMDATGQVVTHSGWKTYPEFYREWKGLL